MQITVDRTSMQSASRSAKPVLAAVLATGAGVTGFAHPLASPRLSPVPPAAPPNISMLVARLEVSPAATLTAPRPIVPAPRESAPRLAEPKRGAPTLGARIMAPAPDPLHLVPTAETEAPAPGIAAMPEPPAIAPPVASESPPALTLPSTPEPLAGAVDGALPALEDQAAPPGPPADSEAPRFVASTVAQGSLGLVSSPTPAPRQPLMMPSAELKAMMVAEVARRDPPLTDTPRVAETAAPAVAVAPARRATPQAIAPQPQALAAIDDAPSGTTIDRVGQTESGIAFAVAARVNGEAAGELPLLIAGDTISVRLGDVLALLEPMMEPAQFAALSTSNSAGEYVPLNRLRASGIAVRFDARDQLILGRR